MPEIETFASTGKGIAVSGPDCSHYMLNYQNNYKNVHLYKRDQNMLNAIEENFSTLAFSRRWLCTDYFIDKYNVRWQSDLNNLIKQNVVVPYPPLYDIKNSKIAQFEHTIHVSEKGVEILSFGDDY